MSTYQTVEIGSTTQHPEWGELDVIVECEVHSGHPGKSYGPPEFCYPSEPAEVEIVKVVVDGDEHDGTEIDCGLIKLADIEDDAIMAAEDQAMDDYDARADYKYDEMKDRGLL